MAAAALAAYPALATPALAAVGAAGWVVLAVALAGARPGLVPPALVLLALEYVLSLGREVDGRSPLVAGLLLLTAELAYWSLELRIPAAPEAGTLRRRAVLVLVATGTSIALGGFMLAVSDVRAGGGVAWEVVGLAAAAGALVLVAVLARRPQINK